MNLCSFYRQRKSRLRQRLSQHPAGNRSPIPQPQQHLPNNAKSIRRTDTPHAPNQSLHLIDTKFRIIASDFSQTANLTLRHSPHHPVIAGVLPSLPHALEDRVGIVPPHHRRERRAVFKNEMSATASRSWVLSENGNFSSQGSVCLDRIPCFCKYRNMPMATQFKRSPEEIAR
jgi:hypothetical protein